MSTAAGSEIKVRYIAVTGEEKTLCFEYGFYIGRGEACQVLIDHHTVSRQHLYCDFHAGCWWVRDLNSRYGTYVNGQAIQQVSVNGPLRLRLGQQGPTVFLMARQAELRAGANTASVSDHATTDMTGTGQPPESLKLSKPSDNFMAPARPAARQSRTERLGVAGVRRAMEVAARKQTLRYRSVFLLLLLLLSTATVVAVHHYYNTRQLGELALDMFYGMKTLELQVVNLQSALFDNFSDLNELYGSQIAEQQQRLEALQQQYAEFMAQLDNTKLLRTDPDRLILHVARLLGESDANAPTEFVTEVKRYIKKWRSTKRLSRAMVRLHENNYATVIAQALKQHQLPPQFLYLALQESNFRTDAIGPQTRYGHAKGMWQFIPQTAMRYGLTIGPQVDKPVVDAGDERHDFTKSTFAAARYLRDIYRTDAQASGLLVLASYNWGEGNILRLLEQMPANPRERNFWQLLQQHNIPKQTYDYVFYIVAAAVIGENPRMFGFDFDNPLAELK